MPRTPAIPRPRPPRRAPRALAALAGLLVVVTGLGLGAQPASALTPGLPRILGLYGYDDAGPNGHHRLILGEPPTNGGKTVTTWQVERWNAAENLLLQTYNVVKPAKPVLTVTGMADDTTFKYRVRAQNADGFGPWSGFEGVQVKTFHRHYDPYASESELVTETYQRLLGRNPGVGELSTATTTIVNERDVATFIDGLANRTARTDPRHPVIRLYLAYFDRAPDLAGQTFWENHLKAGTKSRKQLSAFFAKSNEFKTTYDELTNAQFVELIYQNVLDRTAAGDPGATFWTNELNQGKRTRGDVMLEFSESTEGKKLRAGDVSVADIWNAYLLEEASDELMAIYGQHVLGGGTFGNLALHVMYLGDFQP